MEASKVTIGDKTYDMNFIHGRKKTNLRRKLIIEYIQSKPSGEIIRIPELQKVGRFSTNANTHTFVRAMIRDGVLQRYNGDRPQSYYYGVTGAVRVTKTPEKTEKPQNLDPEVSQGAKHVTDINAFVADMQKLGVKFTLTISNENVK